MAGHKNPKNPDPSYKMDLDFGDSFERENILIPKEILYVGMASQSHDKSPNLGLNLKFVFRTFIVITNNRF